MWRYNDMREFGPAVDFGVVPVPTRRKAPRPALEDAQQAVQADLEQKR